MCWRKYNKKILTPASVRPPLKKIVETKKPLSLFKNQLMLPPIGWIILTLILGFIVWLPSIVHRIICTPDKAPGFINQWPGLALTFLSGISGWKPSRVTATDGPTHQFTYGIRRRRQPVLGPIGSSIHSQDLFWILELERIHNYRSCLGGV